MRSLASLLFFLSFSSVVTSSPLKSTQTRDITLVDESLFSWPETAHPRNLPRRKAETNGDRLKRGLTPLAPDRRYDPTTTYHQLRPRISPVPDGSGEYSFKGCMSGYGAKDQYDIHSFTSNQDALDQCAAHASGLNYDTLGLQIYSTTFARCLSGVSSVTYAQCNDFNAGYYERSSSG